MTRMTIFDVCTVDARSSKLTVICDGLVTRQQGCSMVSTVQMQLDNFKTTLSLGYIIHRDQVKRQGRRENMTKESIGRLIQYELSILPST